MLDRYQIANWPGAPASWTVTDAGMVVQREGRQVVTIKPETFPDLIMRLATVLRKG